MKLLKLYLRKEPTCDTLNGPFFWVGRQKDVLAYASRKDARAGQAKARWSWDTASKPTRRNKRVTLNCYIWQAVWLPDKK